MWRFIFQSGGVTRLHCPCRNDLYTGSIKQTPDMEAFGTFSIFLELYIFPSFFLKYSTSYGDNN
jgi:hypothetical protein